MMTRNILLPLFLFCLLSCKYPKNLEYKDIRHFKLQQAKFQQPKVTMDISLFNPNNYAMRLKQADIDVFINGNKVGKMQIPRAVHIPSRDTFVLPATLSVDLRNALPNALQLVMNSEVNIKLIGTVKAGRHGIFITVPLNYEGKQDILSGLKW
jgi:LEA14-like dessication related protein